MSCPARPPQIASGPGFPSRAFPQASELDQLNPGRWAVSSVSSPLPRSVSSNPLTVVGSSGGDDPIVSHPISIPGVGERGSAPKAPVTVTEGTPGF